MGTGHYEIGTVLGLRQVADPVALNVSAGLSYALPRTVGQERVRPGLGYALQSGISYALNDRWILAEQIAFVRRSNVFLLGPTATQTATIDQAYLSHSLLHNPARGNYTLRLLLTVGLNDASTDYTIGLTFQR